MENGYFQTRLSSVDFEESHFEKSALKKSSSLDALMRQNEDLTARLKVTIQKLAAMEEALDQSEDQISKVSTANQALQDQLLVWKEKEKIWIEKLEIKDQELLKLENKIPHYKNLESEVLRYKKYHEKVKTQVKPYIQQLKDYAKGLTEQSRALHTELANKEYDFEAFKKKFQQIEIELQLKQTTYENSLAETKRIQDLELERLGLEILSLRENNTLLEEKSKRLDQSLARQDELENMTVSYRRKIIELQQKIEEETEGLRTHLQISKNEIFKKDFVLQDLQKEKTQLSDKNKFLDQEVQNLKDQVQSLRSLWTEKCAENDRLKIALQSLERINLELSQKLNSANE